MDLVPGLFGPRLIGGKCLAVFDELGDDHCDHFPDVPEGLCTRHAPGRGAIALERGTVGMPGISSGSTTTL
jgi:hypothetical protein